MKKALYLGASIGALIVAASSAQAADLAVKAPIMRPPPVVLSWTGCYVGGHVGWGWGRHNVRETFFDSSTPAILATSGNIDSSGAVFGGQVGCNYQFAGNWVVGIEGMGAATDINGSNLNPFDVISRNDTDNFNHVKSDWLASITGRVGVTYSDTLFYVKGGGAWIHNRWNISDTQANTCFNCATLGEVLETRTGWTVGAGAEWMWSFAPKWSSFVEYDYYDFGNKTLFAFPPNLVNDQISMQTKQTLHTVKFGANYRFTSY